MYSVFYSLFFLYFWCCFRLFVVPPEQRLYMGHIVRTPHGAYTEHYQPPGRFADIIIVFRSSSSYVPHNHQPICCGLIWLRDTEKKKPKTNNQSIKPITIATNQRSSN